MPTVTIVATNARADPTADPGQTVVLHGGVSCLETDDGDTSYAEIARPAGAAGELARVLFTLQDPLGGVTQITSADVTVVAKALPATLGFTDLNGSFTDSLGTVAFWSPTTYPTPTIGVYGTFTTTLARVPVLADLRAGVDAVAGFLNGEEAMAITYVALTLTVDVDSHVRQRQVPGQVRQRHIPGVVRQRHNWR